MNEPVQLNSADTHSTDIPIDRTLPQKKLEQLPRHKLGEITGIYSAIKPGPLDPRLAETFAGGRYKAVVLQEHAVFIRAGVQEQPLGQFFGQEMPSGILQTRIDKAVLPEWPGGGKSPIDTAFEVKIPAGTEVYIGEVGSQGGFYVGGTEQIVVVKPWMIEGVKVMKRVQ